MAEGGARGGSGCLGTASASASPGLASTASGGVAEPRGAVGEAPGGLMRPKSGMMWGVRRPPPPPIDDGGWGDGVDRSASRKALFPPGFKMHLLRRPAPRNDVSPRRSEFQPEPRAASEPGEAASEPAESVGEGEGEAASERLDRWLGKVVAPPSTVHRILRNEAILASKKRTRMQYETDAGADELDAGSQRHVRLASFLGPSNVRQDLPSSSSAADLGRPAGLGATSSGRSWTWGDQLRAFLVSRGCPMQHLKDYLKSRGSCVSGKKEDLAARVFSVMVASGKRPVGTNCAIERWFERCAPPLRHEDPVEMATVMDSQAPTSVFVASPK